MFSALLFSALTPKIFAAPVAGSTHSRDALNKEISAITGSAGKDGGQHGDDILRFRRAADDYRATVDRLVRRSYQDRRKTLVDRYEQKLTQGEADERTRRISAITLFEDFLRRYPSDKRWSPDVMFRLAELHFEKSNDEYLQAQDAYEEASRANKQANLDVPVQDYSATIRLHERLIRDWPKYRFVDGAYYLLGFCLSEMGEFERGNQAFLALVCHNRVTDPVGLANETSVGGADSFTEDYGSCEALRPKSQFNAEAWTRIGEYHFDENQLSPAIAAYRQVLALGAKDNAYYDEALYKLAWTHYRADSFVKAIKRFDELVVFADREEERTGNAGSEMRPESIQYLAISFAEDDWDDDQVPDAETGLTRINRFYAGRHQEKHVYDVYRRFGDMLFDTTRYQAAVEVFRLALKKWPYRADNPDIQDKIIVSLERERRFEEAMRERQEFTRLFGKNTAWEKKNRSNPAALKKARDYDEQALIQAAVFHHRAGQTLRTRGVALKDVEMLRKASANYSVAAKAYEKYLERFPNTKNSYEIRYSYASCLFFSQRFLKAAAVYSEVRDSNLDNRFEEDAAFSAAKAYEHYIEARIAAGEMTSPNLPTAKLRHAKRLALPDTYQKWQIALDKYVDRLPKSPKSPRLAYKSAEISYRFLDFPAARQRFARVYQSYCQDSVATNAGQAILVTYQADENLNKMQEWATRLSSGQCGGAVAGKVRSGAKQLLVGIKFKRAEALFKDAEELYAQDKKRAASPIYDRAAKAYLALVESNPDSSDADKALYNAAVAYEKSMRFESATKIYEKMWQRYPDSKLAGEAIWRSAENYKRFFEFKRAVNNYLIMSDAPKFSENTHRLDAIYNAAVILENDQDYRRAAKLFLRYAGQAKDPKEAAEAHFRAGVIYQKLKSFDDMRRTFTQFNERFSRTPGEEPRLVEGMYRIARAAAARNDSRRANQYYRRALDVFRTNALAPASDAAEFAATAAFELVEVKLSAFLKRSIKTKSITALAAQKKKFQQQAAALRGEYDDILKYKRARWTLAALYRRGVVFEHVSRVVAEAFRGLEVPRKVRRLGADAVDIYMNQVDQALEKEVEPLEAETKKLYLLCVARAEKLGVSNQYTKEARRRLNALDPGAYPLLNDPKIEVVVE